MRNERTPRTLADTMYSTGYSSASLHRPSRWAGWWLAVIIGAALAAVLAYGGQL